MALSPLLEKTVPFLGKISICITSAYVEDPAEPNSKKGKMWEELQTANRQAIGSLGVLLERLTQFEAAFGDIPCNDDNQQGQSQDNGNYGGQVWDSIMRSSGFPMGNQ